MDFPSPPAGANPGRAVLLTGGRFLYVLNRGAHSDGSPCTAANPAPTPTSRNSPSAATASSPRKAAILTQGNNPFPHDRGRLGPLPLCAGSRCASNARCSLALGTGVTTCGDITAFTIDSTTGRLSLVVNAQVTSASGTPLPFFPVPANPIDFVLCQQHMSSRSAERPPPAIPVFPYSYNPANGQLTINQNTSQPLGINERNRHCAGRRHHIRAG